MLPASTTSLTMICLQRLCVLLTFLASVNAVGVPGTEDTLQIPTTITTDITLHSVSRERTNVHTNLFNNDLRTAYRSDNPVSGSQLSDVDERRKTVKNPTRNGGHGLSTVLYGAYDTDYTAESRNDNSAISEASYFNELKRGAAQAYGNWPLWKSLLQSTSGINSLDKDNLKDRLNPSQGRPLKAINFRNTYIKTMPCNCFIHKIPLTNVPHRPMNSSYRRKNLWLFIKYCNKCLSFMNIYTMIFGTSVTYQVCYSSGKCAAYSQISIRDSVDPAYYEAFHANKKDYEEPPRYKENNNDGIWTRFRRELYELEKTKTVDDHNTSTELETTAMKDQGNKSPTVVVITASALGTLVSRIMKKVGDEEMAHSLRQVVSGIGRALSGVTKLSNKVVQAIF